ncbi:hypothetical protein Taro_025065 [Colocasia esculenta]|uniref:Uncharacterized protein n=1 Tax=Colocasia esculenta TaxID=4460 RepID=A0A843VM97_COLES|nr:hypothetical protein [Colocasia esculenta]
MGAYIRHPERTRKTETTNTAHEAKLTKPTELDTARLQPPCKIGHENTSSETARAGKGVPGNGNNLSRGQALKCPAMGEETRVTLH